MNYTREPIIETVITPREGCKLILRNSKGLQQEDYYVDAVEVISFGNSIFFRSIERPKSFLLPANDYEVIEVKETRMILKSISSDKSIKIKSTKEDEKSEKRSSKKRRAKEEKMYKEKEKEKTSPEEVVKSSVARRLFPPPSHLIKEKLIKEKDVEEIKKEEVVKNDEEIVLPPVEREEEKPIENENEEKNLPPEENTDNNA